MIFSVFSDERGVRPQRVEGPWEQLVESFADYLPMECTRESCLRGKCPYKKGKAWSPAYWPKGGTRSNATVEAVSVLVVDLDHLPQAALEDTLARLEPYDYVLHSSHSDRPEERCVRVILRLSRPVAGTDWARLWRATIDKLGIKADEACKDASRLYFLPSRPKDASDEADDGSGFHYDLNKGEPIDIDAMLALAPPEVPHVAAPVDIPAFKGAPSEEAYRAAVEALGKAWPDRNRHQAQLALAGALTRAGWPEELVAQFCADVAEIQEADNRDHPKRLAAARSSYAKLVAGEPVSGWPTLKEYVPPEAVDAATQALEIGAPADDPEFLATMTEAARARATRTLVPPTREALTAAIEVRRDNCKRSRKDGERNLGKILTHVLRGEFLSEVDEDREGVLKLAALEVVRVAPAGTPTQYILDTLLPSASFLANDLPKIVAEAISQVAEEKKAVKPDPRNLPEPANDEELREHLIRNKQGELKSMGENAAYVIRYSSDTRGHIRFNMLSQQFEITGGRFQDFDADCLATAVSNWLGSHWDLSISELHVESQLRLVAKSFSYNPIEEYLRSLTWDRTPRLDRWLMTYCGAEDTQYVRRVGAQFLISSVARGFDPGSKVDSVLVLHGLEGEGKSSLIEALGDPWVSDTPLDMVNPNNKDSLMRMSSCWYIELAELTSIVDKNEALVKSYLTRKKDDFRTPYGRTNKNIVRRCVFWGTTNDREWMQDHAINRRFWCVTVGTCDIEALRRDRDQLLAEAVFRYFSAELNPDRAHKNCPGERWWFTKAEQLAATAAVSDRVVEDPWVTMIQTWLEQVSKPIGAQPPRTRFILAEVATEALKLSATEMRRGVRAISKAMSAAGMTKIPRAPGSKQKHVWEYIRPRVQEGSEVVAPELSDAAVSVLVN